MDYLSLIGALGSAALSSAGSLYANQQNIKAQKNANAANMEIANANNALAVELANTAHQREVRDLVASGLNPILSAGGNGASVPQLRSPEMGTPQVDNPVSAFGQSAGAIARSMSTAQALDNQGKMIANDYNATLAKSNNLEYKLMQQQYQANVIQADNDRRKAELERAGLDAFTGSTYTPDRSVGVVEPKRYAEAVELARQGIQSDYKMRSNANWRANLGSLLNGAGQAAGAVNSAAKGAAAIKFLLK